jgi:hypothetical protein
VLLVASASLLQRDARAAAPGEGQGGSGAAREQAPIAAAASPTGRRIAPARIRPQAQEAPLVACSFVLPICIHAAPATDPAVILDALQDAEQAMHSFDAIGLPRPLADDRLGGSSAYDIYLLAGAEPSITDIDGLIRGTSFDGAAAFTVLALPPMSARSAGRSASAVASRTGCDVSARIAHALALASLLGLDAGAAAGTLAMAASYVASFATGCDLLDLQAIDDFQRAPERRITSGDPSRPDGSMLFPWLLDDAYGTGAPAGVILGLFAVTPQRTPAGAAHFTDEPDIFDALRQNLKLRGSSLDAVLLDFAVARAFLGSRSDGVHLSDSTRFGDFGRVRFDWSIPYASLPRRVVPLHPIEPTGATYLWLDLVGAPKGAEVTFVAEWEAGSVLSFALVKVDRTGAETARIETGGVYGSTRAERTLVGLDDLAGLLIVGLNAGSLDRSRPFDPDEPPHPCGVTITLAR